MAKIAGVNFGVRLVAVGGALTGGAPLRPHAGPETGMLALWTGGLDEALLLRGA